ncbi:hypothetical protein CHUAL_007434 [Chamberlinius hualienensis]
MAASNRLLNGVEPVVMVSTGVLSEMDHILRVLEVGTVMIKFFPKRRPERRTFCIKLETRQIIWQRAITGKHSYEGAVDLREVKEVRPGKNSKDFERWPDDAKKLDSNTCFSVFYGNEFRLKCLCCSAQSSKECEQWIRGIRYLMKDTIISPYSLQVERWLRKEFYAMENNRNTITLKDLKAFFPRINCKIPTSRLKEVFQEVDTKKRGELEFEGFATVYHTLIHDDKLFLENFEQYSVDKKKVTRQELGNFFANEQQDCVGNVNEFIRNYLQDPSRDVQEPYLTVMEFIDYLFSSNNDLWDSRFDQINEEMNRPLSHYWIASSHNTYLTGDQFQSESSVEAYVRCLQMGCRCIELDCWDGPDGLPYVYHGHTLTTKIKFLDVIKIIKDHAFATSEYPLILSIEDHCTLPQQRNMATAFQEIFGDILLTQPLDREATHLPSPHQLKRKIVLKHKKLPEGTDERVVFTRNEDSQDCDLSNSVKNGILLLEDQIDKEWRPHFFVLTQNKMFYTEEQSQTRCYQDEEDEPEDVPEYQEGTKNDELHFGEEWFHGKLVGGRAKATDLLKEYAHLGDGTFLVRESETFVGDFSLSFWRQGKVNHCRIRSKQERGQTKYYLIEAVTFDSLYSLISHYKSHPLRSQEFMMPLGNPVPQPNKHEGKDWYHGNMTRAVAEDMLRRFAFDGAFLVRRSETDDGSFTISFRAEKKIKHCRIKQEGRLFVIGTAQFETLVELVSYYERVPLYRKMKLRYSVNEDSVKLLGTGCEDGPPCDSLYMDPETCNTKSTTVKALYDYRQQRDDELSFCKHAIISSVCKQDGGWWLGDYGGKKQHWFPSNYVEEIVDETGDDDGSSEQMPLGSMQKGSIDIVGCSVDVLQGGRRDSGREFVFRIMSPSQHPLTPIEIAALSREEMMDWVTNIRETAQQANDLIKQGKEIERTLRIAKELSNLIVYCRSVPFCLERLMREEFNCCEMSSFPETKAEKWMTRQHCKFFLQYHVHQFSRVYPKGQRIDSSNYDPVKIWNCGCQMVALNYQSPDKPMQLNQGRFRYNGHCGYVLKPEFMFQDDFDPYAPSHKDVEPIVLTVRVIAARHLTKSGRGIVSPFVEVEIIGCDFDSNNKYKTETKNDNGFNPSWNEICEFDIVNPELAMLRFVVQDEDMFGDPNFLGQATYLIKGIRPGYRCVMLRNGYSETLELTSLLVHIDIRNVKEEDEDMYMSVKELRERSQELSNAIQQLERDGKKSSADLFRVQLRETEEQLLSKNEERRYILNFLLIFKSVIHLKIF